jgi:tetratricopeptide (TPR) repeat protein
MNISKLGDDIASETHFLDRPTGPFFRRVDWYAFWVTFLIAFGVYFYTMAPTVTLEDSGELAVASDYLGVPHPPGYPIWTLLTWFFQWIFHWVKYFGVPDENLTLVWKSFLHLFGADFGKAHPNPAWGVTLASVVAGALASAVQGMLISRSAADVLLHMKKKLSGITLAAENTLCWLGGVTSGLLLAFSPVLWSQSTIVEVYSLNALFMTLVMLLLYRWMCRPDEDQTLYILSFVFGLGLTNHQTLVFLGPAILIAMALRDKDLFLDATSALLMVVGAYLLFTASKIDVATSAEAAARRSSLITFGIIFLASPGGLFFIQRKLFTEWKRVLISGALVLLGLSFYVGYMPVSSEQNPPMNWGYPRTVEGFFHAVGRGQYERISPVDNFKDILNDSKKYQILVWKTIFDPGGHDLVIVRNAVRDNPDWDFIAERGGYNSVVAQFEWHVAWVALLPFLFFLRIGQRAMGWMFVTLIAFIFLTFIFIIFQYLSPDVQSMFIGRVQYIQAHAVYAMWIGYGLIFGFAWLDAKLGGKKAVTGAAAALILAAPIPQLYRNAVDELFIKEVGGVEQNGHDFGWQFGNWQLEGSRAILAEISEEERATYPNPDYPPPMTTNAVFYGGTDPGRFVPTYMIYSAHVREDVFLITQNALADNTYMNVMRDLYGDQIYIPSQQDSNQAFQEYVADVQAGRIPAGAAVSIEGGRVSVQGVQGVMTINGILAKMIFEKNKRLHDFYVEESYVIPWMYPYLEPHGLIMKINKEPLPELTAEMVKNDTEFWDWYIARLKGNEKFLRDVVARKTFSKLRSAIAGLYASRRMFDESEEAFRQAIALYPLSPEANFRLADIHMQQGEFAEAREIIEIFLREDTENDRVRDFLNQIVNMESLNQRRNELEAELTQGGDINKAMELAQIYRGMGLTPLFDNLTRNILAQGNLPPQFILQIARMFAEMQKIDQFIGALELYVQRDPNQPRIWLDLSAAYAMSQKRGDAIRTLRRAIELGGEPIRDAARQDQRFGPIRDMREFQALVPATTGGGGPMGQLPINLPF